jgi:hypothetical protein
MELQELSKKTSKWAQDIPEISAVILFGCQAKGTATQNSDWDICCILNDIGGGWYGTWIGKSENWKNSFCESTGLSLETVQFTTSTSNQVASGLFECSKVLYVHRPKKL